MNYFYNKYIHLSVFMFLFLSFQIYWINCNLLETTFQLSLINRNCAGNYCKPQIRFAHDSSMFKLNYKCSTYP